MTKIFFLLLFISFAIQNINAQTQNKINHFEFRDNNKDRYNFIAYYNMCLDSLNRWNINSEYPNFIINQCEDYRFNDTYQFIHNYPSFRKQLINATTNLVLLKIIYENKLFDKRCNNLTEQVSDYEFSLYELIMKKIEETVK